MADRKRSRSPRRLTPEEKVEKVCQDMWKEPGCCAECSSSSGVWSGWDNEGVKKSYCKQCWLLYHEMLEAAGGVEMLKLEHKFSSVQIKNQST